MMYEECPHCGASLDYGEKCDCIKKEAPKEYIQGTSNKTYSYNSTEREVCQEPALKKEIDGIFKGLGATV